MDDDRRVLQSGQPIETEETLVLPDGTVANWLTRKMPLRGERRHRAVAGHRRDITHRKRTDAQREATQLKLEMGIQAAGLVMADIDYRTNLNHISAELAAPAGAGRRPDDGAARRRSSTASIPRDRERYLQASAKALDPRAAATSPSTCARSCPAAPCAGCTSGCRVVFSLIDGPAAAGARHLRRRVT
jgi:hypothetical protein